ncbi:MAG TPA: O-antigen polymerase [Chthoniobacteraceae bacterium]|nr:O-antigen polymerase [Chthoniobacteraceae bacterium]
MAFARPHKTHEPPRWAGNRTQGEIREELAMAEQTLAPTATGTILALFGLALTGVFLSGSTPFDVARFAAYGAGLSILTSIVWDIRLGFQNLVRADVLAIIGLYFLTLAEFLVPQPEFNSLAELETTRGAVIACLLGLGGLYAGRHIVVGGRNSLSDLLARPIPTRWMIVVFVSCLFLGHLQMLIAVDFNVAELIDAMMGPRFSQPWGRGRLGDWKALLFELSMLLFLVPPIAGVVFARRHLFSKAQIFIVACGFGFELFYGFSSGTRNLFISFIVAFLIGYAFALPRGRKSEMLIVLTASVAVSLIATVWMLNFRQIGLKAWTQGVRVQSEIHEKLLHVDMNLYVIGELVRVFPRQHPYLGLEVPYLALIRPIPRAIWPNKPEGMSASLESAAGADEEHWTVAASFVGEAYIAGGMIVVLLTGVFFGFLCTWWSQLASPKNSEIGVLIYASGFVAVAISMRSLFVFTTALLPTVVAIVGGRWLINRMQQRAQHDIARQRMTQRRKRPSHSTPPPKFPPHHDR